MMMKSQSNTMSTDNSSAMITTNITSTNNNSAGGNSTNQQPPALRCPRCDSSNTKFCYYNNYSLLQPRYFCKSCRRYWTKGGALRNVPVGGGCRKNKRLAGRQRSTSSSDPLSAGLMASHLISHGQFDPSSFPFGDHHTPRPGPNLSLLHSPDHPPPPSLLYFNLPPADHSTKEALNSPSLHPSMPPADHSSSHGLFSRQLASYLPSSLASQYLSNVNSLNPMQNVGYNHDYLASNLSGNPQNMHPDHAAIGGSAGTSHESSIKAFSVALDHTFNVMDPVQQQPQSLGPWGSMSNTITKPLVHEQKLLTDHKINQLNLSMVDTQGNMELGTSRFTNASHLRHNLQSPKAEEAPTWPAQPTDVAGDQAAHYWNNGGWQDMSGYNSSAHDHHPFM